MGRQQGGRPARPGADLRATSRHPACYLEEAVLRYLYCAPNVHRAQLKHLMEAMRLPSVSVAIIPMNIDRRGIRSRESFDIDTFADGSVKAYVELLSGLLTLAHPDDVALYRRAWEDLLGLAVVGDAARALVRSAAAVLD